MRPVSAKGNYRLSAQRHYRKNARPGTISDPANIYNSLTAKPKSKEACAHSHASPTESIAIGSDINVAILGVKGKQVCIGIGAPKNREQAAGIEWPSLMAYQRENWSVLPLIHGVAGKGGSGWTTSVRQ